MPYRGATNGVSRQRASLALASFVLALQVLSVACSAVVEADRRQCETNDECSFAKTGVNNLFCQDGTCIEGDDPWHCVGVPLDPVNPAQEVPITVTVGEFSNAIETTKPLAGVRVRRCSRLDIQCAEPLDQLEATGDDGIAGLPTTIEEASTSYIELTKEGFVPTIAMLGNPLELVGPDETQTFHLPLFRPLELDVLTSAMQISWERDRAHLAYRAYSCLGSTAGVRVETDNAVADTRGWNVVDGLPTSASETTGSSGVGGYFNMGEGVATVSARNDNAQVYSGTALLRPGWITWMIIAPNRIGATLP
jgi:hypothetical protein